MTVSPISSPESGQHPVIPASPDGDFAGIPDYVSAIDVEPEDSADSGDTPPVKRRARVRGPGLQAKIILLMVISLALLALISSFATSLALRARMVSEIEAQAAAIVQGLETSTRAAMATGEVQGLNGLLADFAGIDGVSYLVVYDRTGRAVASTLGSSITSELSAAPDRQGPSSQLMLGPASADGVRETALDVPGALANGGQVRVGMNFEQAAAEIRQINLNLLVVQALVALVAVLFAVLFSARLVRPIRALVRLAQAVGQGDLSRTIRVRSTDEVGLLSATFNDSVRRLRNLVVTEGERDAERAQRELLQENIRSFLQVSRQISMGDLRLRGVVTEDVLGSVVDSINLMIEEIGFTLAGVREVTHSVHDGADDVLRSSDEVAQRVREQLEAARSVNENVSNVTTTMRVVTQRAEASSGTARQTREAAQAGREVVGETLESMQRIRGEVQGISRRIKALGDRSLEISEIVDTITNISSQTNLLALNAAIEASGAGEYGARFTVVADEVRKLAEESAASSQRISELIGAVQSEILDAVGAMEAGTEEVETGFRLAQQAGERLTEIAGISEASAEVATEISERTSSQAESIERVAETVRVITELAQRSDQSVTEGRKTAEQMRRVADELAERLSRFQLPEPG